MDSINDCYNRCHRSFDRLVAALKSPLRDYGDQIPMKAVVNEYGRFNVWSGSIGAKHPPKKRISLDYRLRDSQFYKIRVVDILLRLERTLRKATELLRNERKPFEEVAYDVEQLSDPDSDDNSATSSTDSSIPDESQQTPREARREMPELYESIQNSIRHLYSMSMVIRRPIPIDRLTRASKIPVQHFRSFDQQHVDECFPEATQVLKKRLANAITLRRQLVMYNEQHHQKSSEIPNPEPAISPTIFQSHTPQPEAQNHNTEPQVETIVNPAPSIFERSTLLSTEATEFTPPEDFKTVDVQSESDTVSSFVFSEGGGERIRIPPRPQDNDDEPLDQFLCPFCCHLVEIETTKAWIKHIFRDLQAYVCTFDDCKEPDRMFETRNDWIRHEFQHHRREWHCNAPDHPVCSSQGEFIDHMREFHTLQVSEDQLQSLSRLCERPAASEVVICPLCTENQHDIQDGFVRFRSSSTIRKVDETALQEMSHNDIEDNLRLSDGRFDEAEDLDKVAGWAMSLPEEYEHLPSSDMGDYKTPSSPQPVAQQVSPYILSSTKLKHHLAQHLERLALFSINTSKMMPDDQVSISTGNAILGSLTLSSSLDSHITVDTPNHEETPESGPLASDDNITAPTTHRRFFEPSTRPTPAGRAFKSLYHDLSDKTRRCIITKNTYIPENELLEIVTVPRVKSGLRSTWSWLRLTIFERNLETKLLRGRKLIAVLAMIGQLNEKSLKVLIANALTDDDLPFCINNNFLQNYHGDKAIKFPGWEEATIDSFLEKQWMVLAPILDLKDGRPIEFDLDEKCALGLSNCEERSNSMFSRVFSAEIPSWKEGVKPRRVAVKHFPYSPRTYTHERDSLHKIKDVKNNHLIKNLATCDQIYCIIFPWAENGDLKQYWEEESDRSLPVFIWSIEQLAGLASALRDLHAVNCRHGDLKPSHIFYFRDDGGTLKIGGLRASQLHAITTDMRMGDTVIPASTRAYEGPESYELTDAPRSRKYDCWSMGCIILEFVIWLLYDQRALDGFHSLRDSEWNSFYRPKKHGPASDDQKTEWWENMERHPKVDEVINLLHQDARVKGTALEELINLVDSKILLINPPDRLETSKITEELQDLVKRCKGGQTPWVNDVDAPRDVPAIFRQEPPRTPDYEYF